MRAMLASLVLVSTSASCKKPDVPTHPPAAQCAGADSSRPGFTTTVIPLPAGGADSISMDYLLYNPRTQSVWVPAGNTGAVDVIDTATAKLTRMDGFATQELERNGKKRVVGPSSATLGATGVYIGSRGDFTVCAVDESKLTKGACGKLDSMPDGIAYVAKTKEVWVTTPRDRSIRILDATTLAQKAKLDFDGEPEGFAVDGKRGRFYTNLEDKDLTLAIDLDSHKTVATWKPNCGEDGPHGLRVDDQAGLLFIACSAKVETMDVGHDGALVGSVDTGDGVDDLDFSTTTHKLYVGAAKAAQLTIAAVGAKGALSVVAVVPTKEGARNGVVDLEGRVYLSHAKGSQIVVVAPAP